MFAVETTDTSQFCGIQAKNISLFRSWNSAKTHAIRLALTNRNLNEQGKHRFDRNADDICWDGFLDGVQKIFDATDGTEETAPALAFITKIKSQP